MSSVEQELIAVTIPVTIGITLFVLSVIFFDSKGRKYDDKIEDETFKRLTGKK